MNGNDVKKEKSSAKYPYYIIVKVVGKIPDGFDLKNNKRISRWLCKLTDCSRGNVCDLERSITSSVKILKVKKKILKIFKKYGCLA